MNDYIVISTVHGTDYLTKVRANSLYDAEHKILDLAFCGNHTYGVTSCTAYDYSTIHTSDCFPFVVFRSQPVSFDELDRIIGRQNDYIRRSDAKE